MRTWRVGTFSMGAALILLGAALIASHYFSNNMVQLLNVWVPVLLIIVGSEILFFLLFQRKESGFIKYDFISIFFVALFGACGIIFTIAASTGLFGGWE